MFSTKYRKEIMEKIEAIKGAYINLEINPEAVNEKAFRAALNKLVTKATLEEAVKDSEGKTITPAKVDQNIITKAKNEASVNEKSYRVTTLED